MAGEGAHLKSRHVLYGRRWHCRHRNSSQKLDQMALQTTNVCGKISLRHRLENVVCVRLPAVFGRVCLMRSCCKWRKTFFFLKLCKVIFKPAKYGFTQFVTHSKQ